MDRETARQEIRSRISCKDYLEKSKNGFYCCPFCGSGNGFNGTGALRVYDDTNTWFCFSCQKRGDVIDLEQNRNQTDYNTALSLLADQIGITIDQQRAIAAEDFAPASRDSRAERTQNGKIAHGDIKTLPEENGSENDANFPAESTPNYTAYYRECMGRLNDPAVAEYLTGRGISIETAAAHWIGYDPAADPARSGHPCPRLIIPTSPQHYIGRRIDGAKEFAKMNPKGSKPAIFNGHALYAQDVQEVFVTEGAFDALSVIEAGAAAIALNSTANAENLIKQLEQRRTEATLILCLDNDDAGRKAVEVLRQGLQRLNIAYITANICGGYKDPNEALTSDKASFVEAIAQAKMKNAARPDNTQYYIDALMSDEIERFRNDRKTGFSNLDAQAGGLYAGLYVLAAISSLGKTSFALQLADQLAASGNDVIFFSLEQSKLELVSKSLARQTAQDSKEKAVTSLAIRKGYLPPQVLEAAKAYKEKVHDRMNVVEGNFNCTISFIGDYIRQYIRRTGTRPVVFIDYLQILQPEKDERGRMKSTKETVDTTVTELKRISRELDLTVICISSVNRANYLTPIDFESLKESGGIEFTADVIWGLQLQCLNEPLFDQEKKTKEKRERVKQAKAENPRKIELSCLKNRYGIANYSCFFEYYPANDLFEETNGAALDFTAEANSTNSKPWSGPILKI